jgi:hypothetical protein
VLATTASLSSARCGPFLFQVRGDVGVAFAATTLLADVLLRRTRVHGNLNVFGHCKRLQNVALSRTNVCGERSSLG